MPELPEVRNVVKYLDNTVVGKTIVNVTFFYNKLLKNMSMKEFERVLIDQTIKDVFPRGKYIIFELTDYNLVSHLRMEGKWVVEKADVYTYSKFNLEMQLDLKNDDNVLRYYDMRRFGTLDITPIGKWKDLPEISKLGPEPWDKEMTVDYLYNQFQRTSRPIKSVLLDQTIILGIGNIYANEILYASKIHPLSPAKCLSKEQVKDILDNTKRILKEATDMGGTTVQSFAFGANHSGAYQSKLMVHGRAGEKCKNCGQNIEKIFVNGRGTYFCPKEQKLVKC